MFYFRKTIAETNFDFPQNYLRVCSKMILRVYQNSERDTFPFLANFLYERYLKIILQLGRLQDGFSFIRTMNGNDSMKILISKCLTNYRKFLARY